MPKRIIGECLKYGVAPMIGLDLCLKALHHSYRIGQSFNNSSIPSLKVINSPSIKTNNKVLTEFEGKELIKKYGISVPHGKLISSSNEALKVAQKLSYPVTLKVSSADLVHKSEKGAVRVNIKNPEMLNKACEDLMKIGPTLLVEKMIESAISELIIGVNYDPTFGKYIVIGSGGILVELLNDSIPLLLPVTREDAFVALSKLKVYPMLQGYRGKPSADIDAVIDVVMSVVDLITSSEIIELDINPLLVMTKGDGAIAVDALVKLN